MTCFNVIVTLSFPDFYSSLLEQRVCLYTKYYCHSTSDPRDEVKKKKKEALYYTHDTYNVLSNTV